MYYTDNRQWICINGYNGYEYSNDGLLRSMKNFKVNPTGKLIKKYKDKKGYYYMLSNNSNEREKVYESTILNIIAKDKNPRYRATYLTDIDSRNRILSKPKKRKKKINLDNYLGIPKFTVVGEPVKKSKNAIYFY